MIILNFGEATRRIAWADAEKLGELNGTFKEDGKGGVYHNYIGNLGEISWLAVFTSAISRNTFDNDILIHDKTFEIKTKPRSVPPRPNFACTVQTRNDTQQTDYYGFTSLLKEGDDFTKAYLVGYMSSEKFRSIRRLVPAGTTFPNASKPSRHDSWEVTIEECEDPEKLFTKNWRTG